MNDRNRETGVTFDASKLSAAQVDGFACVKCGADFLASSMPSVVAGTVAGGQVFACLDCPASRTGTVPCRITWCDAATHTLDSGGYHHVADVAQFTGTDTSDIEIALVNVERVTGTSLPPHIIVRRSIGELSNQLDLGPGGTRFFAELLLAIDPADMVRVAAALFAASAVLDDEDGL